MGIAAAHAAGMASVALVGTAPPELLADADLVVPFAARDGSGRPAARCSHGPGSPGPPALRYTDRSSARHVVAPARIRQDPARGLRPPHPPARPQPDVGVPEALLPRRQPRDRRVPAAALEEALPRGLRRGGRRSAPLRGGRPDRRLRRVRVRRQRQRQLDEHALLREARHASALRRGARGAPRLPWARHRRVHARAAPAPRARPRLHAPRARGRREQRERAPLVPRRNFHKLDAAIFLAQKLETEPELLPPRKISGRRGTGSGRSRDAGRRPGGGGDPRGRLRRPARRHPARGRRPDAAGPRVRPGRRAVRPQRLRGTPHAARLLAGGARPDLRRPGRASA